MNRIRGSHSVRISQISSNQSHVISMDIRNYITDSEEDAFIGESAPSAQAAAQPIAPPTANTDFSCPQCFVDFGDEGLLAQHMQLHNRLRANEDGSFTCWRCQAHFSLEWQLDEHLAEHDPLPPSFQAPIRDDNESGNGGAVGVQFASPEESDFDSDIGIGDEGEHAQDNAGLLECDRCGLTFLGLAVFDDHLIGHGDAPVHWSDEEEIIDANADRGDGEPELLYGQVRRILSSRGQRMILFDGFAYSRGQPMRRSGAAACRCQYKTRCNGRVHYLIDGGIRLITSHNHERDDDQNHCLVSLHLMRRLAARHPTMRPRDIHIAATVGLPESARARLPTYESCRQVIHRIKNKIWAPIRNPKTFADIDIPPSYRVTLSGSDFVQFDTPLPDSGRIIGFATEAGLKLLSRSRIVGGDGTFKYVPKPFLQLYTLVSHRHGHRVPCAHFLLPNKTRTTYQRMLQLLRQRFGFHFERVLLDYELAAILAFQNECPGIEIDGCNYHINHALEDFVKKKLKISSDEYSNHPTFRTEIRRLSALAYVPLQDVTSAFARLQQDGHERLKRLYDYFQSTWIGFRKPNGQWRHGRFRQEMWNCVERMKVDDSTRTTNHNESLHRQYNFGFKEKRPPLRLCLDVLLHEQEHSDTLISRANASTEPKKRRQSTQDRFDALQRVVNNYDPNENLVEYLDRVIIWVGKNVR